MLNKHHISLLIQTVHNICVKISMCQNPIGMYTGNTHPFLTVKDPGKKGCIVRSSDGSIILWKKHVAVIQVINETVFCEK